jgi:hypothetical protein
LLDGLEEQPTLSLTERSFRRHLKDHLLNLLEAKKTYWQQRAPIRWVKLGYENTKLFYAIATQKFRRNYIASLHAQDGSFALEHEHKVAVLWTSFKERLGQPEYHDMAFDLQSLIQPVDLSNLDTPFSEGEVEKVIRELPPNKAPGPDGVDGLFIKKC